MRIITPKNRRKHAIDTDVWTLALERAERAYKMFDTVSVQFSGGKDSTVTLHSVLEVAKHLNKLPLDVVFFDEEAIPYQTEEYVRRVIRDQPINLRWFTLPVQHRNACSRTDPYWWPWAPEVKDLWVREKPPEGISHLDGFPTEPPMERPTIPVTNPLLYPPDEWGNHAMCMGIRTEESMTRLRAMLTKSKGRIEDYIIPLGSEGRYNNGNVWKVYPVYDWSTLDVWTAPAKFGWDYNEAYDIYEMMGVSPLRQRLGPAFGEEPLQALHRFHEAFPEIWDAMTDRVPGAAAAARYATTELWGFGAGSVMLFEGNTPEQQVLDYLDRWPEPYRTSIAQRLKKEMANHFKKCDDPILLRTAHPDTGLSWKMLFQIAMRGDFKARRTTRGAGFDMQELAERRAKWQAEYDQMYEEGLLK